MNSTKTIVSLGNQSNRVKCAFFCPEVLMGFLKGPEGQVFKTVKSGVPSDVEFRGVTQSFDKNGFNIFMSHPSFDIVPPGGVSPEVGATLWETLQSVKIKGIEVHVTLENYYVLKDMGVLDDV